MIPAARPPVGLTLIETLVAMAILSIMAVIGVRVVQDTGQRAQDVHRISVTHRHDLVIVQLLRQDFDHLARMPSARRELPLSPGMNSLGLPDATWRWGADGLRRRDHRTGIEIVLLSQPTEVGFELLRRSAAGMTAAVAKPSGEPLLYNITIARSDAASSAPQLHLVLPATRRLQ